MALCVLLVYVLAVHHSVRLADVLQTKHKTKHKHNDTNGNDRFPLLPRHCNTRCSCKGRQATTVGRPRLWRQAGGLTVHWMMPSCGLESKYKPVQ